MPAVVWDGIEAWWGAQAISTMIGTWSIRWANWQHPLANGTMELKDFIGFIIYHFIFLGVMWLPPEKLHRPFHVSFVGFTMVIIGLVIWSTHTAGGGGQYFASDYKPPSVLAGSIGKMPIYRDLQNTKHELTLSRMGFRIRCYRRPGEYGGRDDGWISVVPFCER